MPRKPTGGVYVYGGTHYARVTVGRARRSFALPHVTDERAARERAAVLAQIAADLRAAHQLDLAEELIGAGAQARTRAELDEVLRVTRGVCRGDLVRETEPGMTFRELGRMWTSGELHRRWPDHVKLKKTAHRDAALLESRVYPLVGGVRLVDFTLDHAERVMRSLPEMEPATRRQHAQAIARIMRLAAYPVRAIERSPIPPGFVPPLRSNKAMAYLYPDEERALLACAAVPLGCRVLYGFLAREGCREGEARAMTWSDLDLLRGTIRLDTNKTDDPRAWALNASVARALAAWRRILGGPPTDDPVFERCGFDWDHAARTLRAHLRAAGVERPELYVRSKARLAMRVHDLRGTFVTLSLANGRTETWVADRTGHKSSVMINRYRRAARTAAELGLGELAPMDEAIPELRETAGETAGAGAGAPGAEPQRRDTMEESRAGGTGRHRRLKIDCADLSRREDGKNPAVFGGAADETRRDGRVIAVSAASPAVSSPMLTTLRTALGTAALAFDAGELTLAHELRREEDPC